MKKPPDKMTPQNKKADAYRRSLKFLGPRARSTREVFENLRRKGFDEKTVTETIEILKNENLLDDRAFAAAFVENRETFRPRSRFALQQELYRKGIDNAIVQSVFMDVDEYRSAFNALILKMKAWQNCTSEEFRKKAMNFLKSRGFNREVSVSAYQALCNHIETGEENP